MRRLLTTLTLTAAFAGGAAGLTAAAGPAAAQRQGQTYTCEQARPSGSDQVLGVDCQESGSSSASRIRVPGGDTYECEEIAPGLPLVIGSGCALQEQSVRPAPAA